MGQDREFFDDRLPSQSRKRDRIYIFLLTGGNMIINSKGGITKI
jgi:hypothetical protein